LVDFKVTWKILTGLRLNYCFQSAHSQTQLGFVVIQPGESSFNLISALIWGNAVIHIA